MTTPRAELIHIEVDRRLGHEWDEWDGKPLPNSGNFDAPARLFLYWGAATMMVAPGGFSSSTCLPACNAAAATA